MEERWSEKYLSSTFKFKIQEENRERIIQMIEEKLIPSKPEYKIELIEKICKIFSNLDNNVLKQFVYYIREDFTKKSKIKDEIFNLPRKQLQKKVIYVFEELRVRYLDLLFNYTEEILKIFTITETTADYPILKNLFHELHIGIKNNRFIISENTIQNIDQMCLKDKRFHKLKLSLLDLFLKNLESNWDNEIIISVLIYLLKSLSLDWPLGNTLDRNTFISLTSQLFQNYAYFYTPGDTFTILEKPSATEKEILSFILKYEKELTHKRRTDEDKKDVEYAKDFTEDDKDEDDIFLKT